MRNLLLTLMFLSVNVAYAALGAKIDSLQNLLNTEIHDTSRVKVLVKLAYKYGHRNIDSAISYGIAATDVAKGVKDERFLARALRELGWCHYLKGEYDIALQHYLHALEISERNQHPLGISASLGNIGVVYEKQGKFQEALTYYMRALKIDEENDLKRGIAIKCGNLGIVFKDLGDYPKALEYHFRAMKMNEELDRKRGISLNLGNIGVVYARQGDHIQAIEYYTRAMTMDAERGNKSGVARHHGNIGGVYQDMDDHSNALKNYLIALETYKELGNENGVARQFGNIGGVYTNKGDSAHNEGSENLAEQYYQFALDNSFRSLRVHQRMGTDRGTAMLFGNIGGLFRRIKQFQKAESYLDSALVISTEMGALFLQQKHYLKFSNMYMAMERYQLALEYYRKYTNVKDSLFNESKSKEVGKLEAKYEFEKADAELKRQEEELANRNALNEARRNNLQYSGILIFIVLLFAGVFMLGKFSMPIRLAEGMIFFSFLLFFEFTLVLLDPYIENFSGGAPAYKLMFNALLAAMIFPLHSLFESRMKRQLMK